MTIGRWSLISPGAALLLLGVTFLTTGCGSSSAHLRFVHAAPLAGNVDYLVDGKVVSSNGAYGTSAGYFSVSSGSRTVEIRPTGNTSSSSDLFNSSVSLASGSYTTAILELVNNSATATVYTDDHSKPASGQVRLRAIHADAGAGNLDVYLVSAGSGIAGVSPQVSNLTYTSSASPSSFTVSAGSYQMFFTFAGTQGIVVDTGQSGLTLTSGQVRTVVALEPIGVASFLVLSDLN